MPRRLASLWTMTLAIAALAAIDALASHAPSRTVGSWCAPILRPMASRTASLFSWTRTLRRTRTLAAENMRLRDELTAALAGQSELEDALRDAEFLRQVAGLDGSLRTNPREASIFSYGTGPERTAMLNLGADSGIAPGDVVITAAGALVGRVTEAGDGWSTVRLLTDASLEVTGRVLGTDIGGLVRHDALDGLVLDLVGKEEAVDEGQVIVTSGDDRFPAGIVIASVRAVDRERTTLFALVRLTPAVDAPVRGPVVVISP